MIIAVLWMYKHIHKFQNAGISRDPPKNPKPKTPNPQPETLNPIMYIRARTRGILEDCLDFLKTLRTSLCTEACTGKYSL